MELSKDAKVIYFLKYIEIHQDMSEHESSGTKEQMYATFGSPFTSGLAEPKSQIFSACV